MTQTDAATKDDIARLDSRIDRLEDRMDRGFAALHKKIDDAVTGLNARMDRMNTWQLRYTLALAALIVAANRWL